MHKGKYFLLRADKIFIFATFLNIIYCSLTCMAADRNQLQLGKYTFIFPKPDSLLVQQLVGKIRVPLFQLENFFPERHSGDITVLIVRSEDDYHKYTPTETPYWSQAIARPAENLVVIKLTSAEMIAEAPRTILHELTHLLIANPENNASVPAWLNEGLAEYLSGSELSLDQKVLIANALATRDVIELMALDSLLNFHQTKAQLAYAEALSAVEFFILRHGANRIKMIVQSLNRGSSLDEAFNKAIGMDFLDFEISWYEYLNKTCRWLIILNLEGIILSSMAILALTAIIVVRWRNYKKVKKWEEKEKQQEDNQNN